MQSDPPKPDEEQGGGPKEAAEKKPLLGKKPGGLGGLGKLGGGGLGGLGVMAKMKGFAAKVKKKAQVLTEGKDVKLTHGYDPESLTSWHAVLTFEGTVFAQRAVLGILVAQLLTATAVAGLVFHLSSHPERYNTRSIRDFVETLSISIGMLLGLFLRSCLARWWDTVKSLESLFGSIKKLTMTLINLELPDDLRKVIGRRCVMSVLMLEVEQIENHAVKAGTETRDDLQRHWAENFAAWEKEERITAYEAKLLKSVPQQQRSFFCWSLVSKALLEHRHHLEGAKADAMAYDRLVRLVQSGVASLSGVRTAAAFQMPYIYMHLLAFMIHIVNVLTAVGAGLQVGLIVATATKEGKFVDWNSIVCVVLSLLVQSFVYQAFLTIGAALSFPVTGTAYRIPLKLMGLALEYQLRLMNRIANFSEEDVLGMADDVVHKRESEDPTTIADSIV